MRGSSRELSRGKTMSGRQQVAIVGIIKVKFSMFEPAGRALKFTVGVTDI